MYIMTKNSNTNAVRTSEEQFDDWILEDLDAEDNYTIARYEVRVKGRKPLVLVYPSMSKLLSNVRQYIGCSDEMARRILIKTIIETPDPLSFDDHFKLLRYLENNC